MNNARIDRMLRELNSDPSHQFFSALFGLVGLGKSLEKAQESRDTALAVSLLRNVLAR